MYIQWSVRIMDDDGGGGGAGLVHDVKSSSSSRVVMEEYQKPRKARNPPCHSLNKVFFII